MDGCLALGRQELVGTGGPFNPPNARVAFERACVGGKQKGCVFMGILLEYGDGGGIDVVKASEFYMKACEENDGQGCYLAGTLGEPAQHLLDRACQLDYKKACK